jgi:hypothetical protein
MLISEIFGRSILDTSPAASKFRESRHCPFRDSICTKSSKKNPLGICSLSDGIEAAAICPVRFLEGDRVFRDAAKIAFGSSCEFAVFPEIRVLRIPDRSGKRDAKIGKVDFLLGHVEAGQIKDFAALEVQASYFSGEAIRPAMNHFLKHGALDNAISDRRPDFRSSAQKRLFPQLQLKVPIFRRWGKKFFVVVDTQFFNSLPVFKTTTPANSEIIWLKYPIRLHGNRYTMDDPEIVGTQWDDLVTSLREGIAPEREEVLSELQMKLGQVGSRKPRVLMA